jgi:hypothetical protein
LAVARWTSRGARPGASRGAGRGTRRGAGRGARRGAGLAFALLSAALMGLLAVAPPAAGLAGPARAAGLPGAAGSQVDTAIAALRTGTLYVAPGAGPVDAAALRQALNGATRVVVAVLSPAAAAEAGGEVDGLPGQIGAGLNRAGTVLVLAGNRVALASVGDDQAVLARAVDTAQAALDRGPGTRAQVTAVLAQLVREARQAPSAFPRASEQAPSRAGAPTPWTGYVGLLLVLAAAGAMVAWLVRRGRRRRPASPPHRRVHVDAAGRLISVEDAGRAP